MDTSERVEPMIIRLLSRNDFRESIHQMDLNGAKNRSKLSRLSFCPSFPDERNCWSNRICVRQERGIYFDSENALEIFHTFMLHDRRSRQIIEYLFSRKTKTVFSLVSNATNSETESKQMSYKTLKSLENINEDAQRLAGKTNNLLSIPWNSSILSHGHKSGFLLFEVESVFGNINEFTSPDDLLENAFECG